ncbi:MAG: hypothetical protein QM820_40415 [Minicystis sp.]
MAKVKAGYKVGDKTYKVHLDGFNLLPALSGKEKKWPREGFLYWSDDGDLLALRVNQYKITFAEQRSTGMAVWREPFTKMRIPRSSTIYVRILSSAETRAFSMTSGVPTTFSSRCPRKPSSASSSKRSRNSRRVPRLRALPLIRSWNC